MDWTFSGIFSNPTNQFAWIDDVVVTPGATAPFLADSPPDQVQGLGADVHLSVSPQGTPPFSYQWRFGNSEIPGATGANFMITNIGPGKVGEYSVVVSNQAGAVFSQPAHISSGSIAIWGNWVLPPAFTNAVGLGAGEYHWLAIQPDHTVLSWGLACCAQTNVPPNLSNVVAVAGGAYFSLALTMDGHVVAWGESSYGQLNIPQDLSNVVAIVGGQNHALALKNDGAVVAWGDNSYGQTNIPSTLTNVVSIAAGGNNSMALSADGTVTVWGTNYSTVTNVPSWIQDVVAISVGQDHCLALKGDGTITAWGNSSLTNVPSDLTNVVAISAGSSHDLALRSDGKVTSWGWNFGGDTDVPQQLSNISVIQAGGSFSLALVGSGGTKNSVGISNFQRTGNSFSASVRSDLHRVYRLEYQTQLGNGNWIGLPLARGNGGVLVLTDSLAGDSQRFYRVRSW